MKQLIPMERTDRPSTLFLFLQNPMSFLKAKKSKTECSRETQKVRARKKGLPSSSTLLNSSDSPSAMAPQDCCKNMPSSNKICDTTMCTLHSVHGTFHAVTACMCIHTRMALSTTSRKGHAVGFAQRCKSYAISKAALLVAAHHKTLRMLKVL